MKKIFILFITVIFTINLNAKFIEPMDENPPENLKYLISKLQISDFFTDDVYVSLEALPLPSYGSYEIIKKDKITLRDNNQTWQKMLKNKKKSTVTFAINFMMI